MKKYNLILLIILVLGFASCNDFLQEEVYNEKGGALAITNDQDAELIVVGTYSKLQAIYDGNQSQMLLNMGGIPDKQGNNWPYAKGTFTSADNTVANWWAKNYDLINLANDAIHGIQNSNAVSDSIKNMTVGEARLLRGWAYFNLVRSFLKAPIQLEPTTSLDGAIQPIAPGQQIYDEVIIPDMEYAFENLPLNYPDVYKGRVTKGTAAAMLAKVYMRLAGNTDGSPHWTTARDYAKWVIDNGGYSLHPDFAKLWSADKNTSESIFEVQYSNTSPSTGNALAKVFASANSGWAAQGGGWAKVQASCRLMDDWIVNNSLVNYDDPEKPLIDQMDYRFPSTFNLSYTNIKNGKLTIFYTVPGYSNTKAWPQYRKWIDPAAPGNSQSGNNFIVIRYPDVLLMFAECDAEVNGAPTAAGYDAIDLIMERARNGVNDYPMNWERTYDKAGFIERIAKERTFELSGEHHLWFDLTRRGWEAYSAYKNAENDHTGMFWHLSNKGKYNKNWKNNKFPFAVEERHLYLPIPTTEIYTNPEVNFDDQNAGY